VSGGSCGKREADIPALHIRSGKQTELARHLTRNHCRKQSNITLRFPAESTEPQIMETTMQRQVLRRIGELGAICDHRLDSCRRCPSTPTQRMNIVKSSLPCSLRRLLLLKKLKLSIASRYLYSCGSLQQYFRQSVPMHFNTCTC
jgi:hypothetical protein